MIKCKYSFKKRKVSSHQVECGLDFPPSIVAFLVVLLLCLGMAMASGAESITGIVAGITGGIVAGIFSGSNLSISGPAAGLTAIVTFALDKLPGYEVFKVAVLLAGSFKYYCPSLQPQIIHIHY